MIVLRLLIGLWFFLLYALPDNPAHSSKPQTDIMGTLACDPLLARLSPLQAKTKKMFKQYDKFIIIFIYKANYKTH